MPATLSLCMIVKNEAELLPRFLAAAEGLWDQLCVVDTGSSDGTVELLEGRGADVLHRPWDDDFSAARNFGLAQARGDWIAFFDADEMLTPALVAEVRHLVDDGAAGAATVVMRNLLPHGHRREASVLRLFRNHPSIRFSHPIHEDASEAVRRYLGESGLALRHLAGAVDHLGYVREHATSRDKRTRDSRLLLACVEREPEDLYSWFKLLELARFWNDRALWTRAAASASQVLDRLGPGALVDRPFGGELVTLIADGRFASEPAAALRYVSVWADRVVPSAALFLRRGELRELLGETARAAADFARCFDVSAWTSDRQLSTVRPLMGLARLALARGDVFEAWQRVEGALGHNPRDPEALLLAVVIAHAHGGAVALDRFVSSYASAYGECSELHEALGEAAFLAGRAGEAVAELRRAAGEPPAGRTALRLAQALVASGDVEAACQLARSLVRDMPEARAGILVCELAAGHPADTEITVEGEGADQALRPWVDALRRGRREHLAAFRRNARAVYDRFPWLPALVGEAPQQKRASV